MVQDLNLERNNRILLELKWVCGLLNEIGIEPVVLKGAAYLLCGVYPDRSARFLRDLDLLLPPADFPAAVRLLKSHGYFCDDAHPVEVRTGNAYPALRRQGSVEIDLHRDLTVGRSKWLLPGSEIFSKSVVHELDTVRLRLPSPEHLVIHHIVHSQIHDFYHEKIRPSLRNMYDMIMLQRRFGSQVEWVAIETRFRGSSQYDALALYLKHVETTLRWESPLPIQMTALLWIRWWRRTAFRRVPFLRFVDPLFLYKAGVKSRTPLAEIIRTPGGWWYLLSKLLTKSLYVRRLKRIG